MQQLRCFLLHNLSIAGAISWASNQGGAEEAKTLEKFSNSPEKNVGHSLKALDIV